MKSILKLEEAAKFMLSYYLTLQFGFSWWVFWAWLLVPDVSMIGYLVNPKVGAALYNLAHHQGLALGISLAGYYFGGANILLAGIIMFGHSSMDRIFGYGLKYEDDFKHTHLGLIGKASQ